MEEARKLDLRPLLVVAGVVAVALTLWASGAFAAGGSSSNQPGSSDPFAASIQSQGNGQSTPREDCPHDRGGGSGGGGRAEARARPDPAARACSKRGRRPGRPSPGLRRGYVTSKVPFMPLAACGSHWYV
jgi:hypothetical protein